MNTNQTLAGSHLRTYNKIFQSPMTRELGWLDVHALFRHLGQAAEDSSGSVTVTRNGHTVVLQPTRTRDLLKSEQVLSLRHFLEESEATQPAANGDEAHWLLVIDHREARIFRAEMQSAVPQRILPHAPEEYFRQAQDSEQVSKGKEKPDPNSYFEPVAKALQAAGPILVFGTGTGTGNEMDQFVAWLKDHHPQLALRIIGTQVVDESHLTEGQMLVTAREFYESAAPANA